MKKDISNDLKSRNLSDFNSKAGYNTFQADSMSNDRFKKAARIQLNPYEQAQKHN